MKPDIARVRLLACALLFSIYLGGCASSPQTRLLLDNPPDVPALVELSEVPFFPQREYHCAPASLAGIINYRGTAVAPDQIADLVYVPELKGSLQVEIVAAARQFDMVPVKLDGRLESLLRELAVGNPVFVLQNLALEVYPVWHYEILIGYDLDKRHMILRSGVNRRITRRFALFEKTWQRADHWALALVTTDSIPATASAEAYIDAVIGMEQVGRTSSARQAYATALQRWPDNLLAHTGLGNSAYAMGEFAVAESAYREALEIDPQKAEIWNNLAYALAQLGRHESSINAIARALELDPDNQNFKDSLRELGAVQ
ncbi:MAG: PA2778 family cysteine peptidase [Gammaproteobacteria bacterium]|nr:PA2778 family cysteine peptidase [Gammaproteobacteria bacterium]